MSRLWKLVGEFYLTVGVPLVYLAGLWLVATKGSGEVSLEWMVGGLLLSGVGIVMWITSYLSLGKAFGVLPRAQKRVRRGLYAHLKHPMYMGIMATYLGLSIAMGSEAGLSWTVLVIGPMLFFRARAEEGRLHA